LGRTNKNGLLPNIINAATPSGVYFKLFIEKQNQLSSCNDTKHCSVLFKREDFGESLLHGEPRQRREAKARASRLQRFEHRGGDKYCVER
jgi:hypothetical protein